MESQSYQELDQERRRLQGSVNYWKNTTRAYTQHADVCHATTGKQRQETLVKLAYSKQRAAEAQRELDKIKQQIAELDPKGSLRRQLHSTQTNIDSTRRKIKHLEEVLQNCQDDHKAAEHWTKQLQHQQERIALLQIRLDYLQNKQPAAPPRHEAGADTLQLLARIPKASESLR